MLKLGSGRHLALLGGALAGGALVLAGVSTGVGSALRQLARDVYYEHVLGTPLIKEVPRTRINCSTISRDHTMVLLIAGQSNAANFSSRRNTSSRPIYNFHGGRCYLALDPLLGADGGGGSVWMPMADLMIARGHYAKAILVPVAVAGSAISRWSPGGDLHARLERTIQDMQREGIAPTHVLWHQGEADASLGTSTRQYLDHLDLLIDSLRAQGVLAPVYVSLATYCKGGSSELVRRAQIEARSAPRNVMAGVDSDRFVGPMYRRDDCHLSERGTHALAEEWVRILAPQPAVAR